MPDASQPTIRRATPADAEALARIGAVTFTETFAHLYPPEHLAAFLAEAHSVARGAGGYRQSRQGCLDRRGAQREPAPK